MTPACCGGPTAGSPLAHRWLTAGPPLAHRWPTAGPPLAHRWPTAGSPLAHGCGPPLAAHRFRRPPAEPSSP